MKTSYQDILTFLYGSEAGHAALERLLTLIKSWREKIAASPSVSREGAQEPASGLPLDQRDAFLITYGDQFSRTGEPPLKTLKYFLDTWLPGIVRGVHILPFFPYTSDDGFSISEYRAVNPALGGWDDIRAIASEYRLMVDHVLNHCSAENEWFRAFLRDEEKYRNYVITVPPGTDISMIARPRALPLLTPFETAHGEELVWTTFSSDQVDLNFAEPDVLLEMIDVFLLYLSQGARVIRLDAIAYLWKELGTPGIHHPKTHAVVRLLRSILEDVVPGGVLITETNVPHRENISYFGNGNDEAHMVYQFSLPPLVLHAFLQEDATYLSSWAAGLPDLQGKGTFFNFLASHDGVGILPARGILPDSEVDAVLESVKNRGGRISYKATAQGDIPYEMNINYRDAVAEKSLPVSLRARKFLTSQAVMLALPGVPGIYVHSIIGSGNWEEGLEKTGANRSINREKLVYSTVEERISRTKSLEGRIFEGYRLMLEARRKEPAFHPAGALKILKAPRQLFAFFRFSPERSERILCLHNLGKTSAAFAVPEEMMHEEDPASVVFQDCITGRDIPVWEFGVELGPWETLWLKEKGASL